MSSKYLPNLIQIAQEELPQLQYTLDNASTVLALQDAVKRQHNIITYLIHHAILSSPEIQSRVAAPARPVQQHVAPQQPVYQIPPGYRLVRDDQPMMPPAVGVAPATTHYPHTGQMIPATPPIPHGTVGELPIIPLAAPGAPAPVGGNVADVTITRHGTRVVAPGGQAMTLPPGVPVDATGGSTPDGIILPPGGAMTEEMEAALAAARSAPPPPARNITHEQPQG
jgi:hypothetical protein